MNQLSKEQLYSLYINYYQTNISKLKTAKETKIDRSTVRKYFNLFQTSNIEDIINTTHSELASLKDYINSWSVVEKRCYTYILAQYFGDGYINKTARTWKLRISNDKKYENINCLIEDCLTTLFPNNCVSRINKTGCWDICVHSKKLPILFPHLGQGKKHERKISLTTEQLELLKMYPKDFILGCLHSDGAKCKRKTTNHFYQFTNLSLDIKEFFEIACSCIGIPLKNIKAKNVYIYKREYINIIDSFYIDKS
jgi:intein-encoded DNA endonuclease-like protein